MPINQKNTELLKEVLNLKYSPVAVTYTNEELEIPRERTSICRAIKKASEGKTYYINAKHSACPGGTWHCGLAPRPNGEPRKKLQKFLTQGEKLYHTTVAFERSQKQAAPIPENWTENILIAPLDKTPIRPDILIFTAKPGQVARLILLDTYWDGIPIKTDVSGALCHSAITTAIVTGKTNITLGDTTARKNLFADDEMFFILPYERLDNLIKAIPLSTAGTAEMERP